MRIAVLSDIHGNLPALEAVLASLEPYDAVWQLGDVVGYGPQPDEVVARLRDLGATGVRGNHDAAAVGELSTEAFNDEARAAVEWTARTMSPETRKWLAALPQRHQETPFTLAHGSPRDPTWEYVYSIAVARSNFPAFATDHCLVGHTHVPLAFRDAGGRIEAVPGTHGTSLTLDERRTIINPGSVGQPRDGDARACGMVLDTSAMAVEWHRVEYPIAAVKERMEQAGLPWRLAARLDFGL